MSADISELGRFKILGGIDSMLDSSCFGPSARIKTVVVVGGMAQCVECRVMGSVIERVKEKCRPGEKGV